MRKKRVIIALLFICLIVSVKIIDITNSYDIGIVDYIRYSMPLTSEEEKFLKKSDLEYGLDINDEPFAFVSLDTNQNSGIWVDYFNQLSVLLECKLKPVVFDSYSNAIRLKYGKVDCSVLNITSINDQVFDFTQPLYIERNKLLVDGESSFDNLSQISNMTIAVISGSSAHHAANEKYKDRKDITLVLTSDLNDSFIAFAQGEVDAILGDEAKISYLLNNALKRNKFKFLEGSISEEEVAVAVNKDQQLLLSILNKGILEMKKNHQYYHIHSKWFGSYIPEVEDDNSNDSMVNLVLLLVSLGFGLIVWNRTISEKVIERTRELDESREELQGVIDSLKDGFLVTDDNGKIMIANHSILNILHMNISEIIGKDPKEVDEIAYFINQANTMEGTEKEGRFYWVTYRKLNEFTNKDLLFLEDYTIRQKYEKVNRQEAKMVAVGELSAGLAHEIRNPLGLIKNYIYILKKKVSGDTEKHAIEVMDDSVDRINQLIENLLGFSRIKKSDMHLVNLKRTIDSIIALESDRLKKNGIDINFTVEKGLESDIPLNEEVLKICVVNLINNSIDAIMEKSQLLEEGEVEGIVDNGKIIDIRAVVSKEIITLAVDDTGIGIPDNIIESVINPFYTTKESGTGLGLYILNSEVRRIGGQVYIESKEGVGTTVKISVPLGKGEEDGNRQ